MFDKVRRNSRIGRSGWRSGWNQFASEQTTSGAKVPLAAIGARWSAMGGDEKQEYKDRAKSTSLTFARKKMFGKVRIRCTGWMEFVSEQTPSGAKVLPLAALGARWSGMGDDEKQKYKDRALAARIKKPDRPAAEAAVRLKTFNEIETTIETPAAVSKQEPVCFIT